MAKVCPITGEKTVYLECLECEDKPCRSVKATRPMTFRDYAKSRGIEVIGKLTRVPDRHYGAQDSHYPLWVDEAGNEYMGNERTGFCIVTKDGKIY